jgi:hypothetical protein
LLQTRSCNSHPGVLGSILKREEPGKQAHQVPLRVPVRDGQTSPHRPRIVVSRSTCPPPSPSPHTNNFIIGTAVINNCRYCSNKQYSLVRDGQISSHYSENCCRPGGGGGTENHYLFASTGNHPTPPWANYLPLKCHIAVVRSSYEL